jgi:hypothetical protein
MSKGVLTVLVHGSWCKHWMGCISRHWQRAFKGLRRGQRRQHKWVTERPVTFSPGFEAHSLGFEAQLRFN